MEKDKNEALKRYMASLTSRREARESGQGQANPANAIVGNIETFNVTGNVFIFTGAISPEAMAMLLEHIGRASAPSAGGKR